jgi:hypothetical protein
MPLCATAFWWGCPFLQMLLTPLKLARKVGEVQEQK